MREGETLTVQWTPSGSEAIYYRIITQACYGETWYDWTSDEITDTYFTFDDDWTCLGLRGGTGVHACNDVGCSSGVRWTEPPAPAPFPY